MAINYTSDMVSLMKDRYSANPTRETVEELAEELDKSIKSVIGKLSREGVYQKTEYLTKESKVCFEVARRNINNQPATRGVQMRICKITRKGIQEYAEVMGLTDTPTGVKARLRFPDGTRDLVSTTQIRMLQDKDLEKLGVGKLSRKLWGS